MNEPTPLPQYLTDTQRTSVNELFTDVEILPISCLLFEADEHKVITRNRRLPDDFFYMPKRGRLIVTVCHETREIGPGEFMMVTAGVSHEAVMADGFERYEVFALHVHALDSNGHRLFERFESPFGTLPDCEQWFKRFATCTHLMGLQTSAAIPFFRELVRSLILERLLQGHQMKALPRQMDERISRLLAVIRVSFDQAWTVPEMAKRCSLSVSRFRELFSKSTGLSPKKYVQKIRLTHARSLLATEPDLTVEQVADRVGICDPHYFHVIYKKEFGETPKGVRTLDGR